MKNKIKLTFILLFLLSCSENSNHKLNKQTIYFNSGELKEKFFIDSNNERQGVGYEYYEDGKIKEKRTYLDNQSHGVCKNYYPNGKLSAKAIFKKNIQVDTTFQYFESGVLEALVIKDKNGESIKDVFYYPNGKIKEKRAFLVGRGEIISKIKYDIYGNIVENESKYATISLASDKSKFIIELHNNNYLDSIHLLVIKEFNFNNTYKSKVLRTVNYTNTNKLYFEVLKTDYVKGKLNIMVIAQKYEVDKNNLQQVFYLQRFKDKPLLKDNVYGIYRE